MKRKADTLADDRPRDDAQLEDFAPERKQDNCPECLVHGGHKACCSIGNPQAKGDFSLKAYRAFLKAKCPVSLEFGITIDPAEIFETAQPGFIPKSHQVEGVGWAVRGGRRALFESFGLGKTVQELEIIRLILKHVGGRGLIVAPLGVRQEFTRDAKVFLGIDLKFIRRIEEADDTGIYLTNYETVRDGKLDPAHFTVASLDEAAILSSFGGTKTFREFMRLFANVAYRFVATATPDPNEYIELLAYADFLGIMDTSQAKTRFFQRDSVHADRLTIHPHKEKEFWLWVASWALFLNKPSDLGYDDSGYALPELIVIKHEVQVDHSTASNEKPDKGGYAQGRMFREAKHGVSEAAREKRDTLPERIAKMEEILAADPEDHFLIWHDLEAERKAIEAAVPNVVTIYGALRSKPGGNEYIEDSIMRFNDGEIQNLAGKPSMIGSGTNMQKHCHKAIFLGIGFKFREFIQGLHRIFRFLQLHQVTIHLIFAESERLILENLLDKWERHKAQTARMAEIIRTYGLSQAAIQSALTRTLGVERTVAQAQPEAAGERPSWTMILNDTVEEIHEDSETAMPANSVDLILTSIPFSTQYEYSPSYNDFGHTDDNEHFFRQMDFLTPQLLRVLKPGRMAHIHVKDRIVPGGITGLGFQTVYPFHARAIEHFIRHGFGYLGMKTIVTDVVRENKQTNRLGWTEQCKDGSKMGVGMPEYLLIFRKPPTETVNAYADQPVVKSKPLCVDSETGETGPYDKNNKNQTIVANSGYSRARWQLDAHGFMRSSGNRLLTPEDLEGIAHHAIYKKFRRYSKENVYDFENHVTLGESLEQKRMLPSGFMLLPPQSWHPDVWTDITRMRTLNGIQWAKGKEQHLCPMQFDIANRVIVQCSMEGETVFDPFGGLGTVAYCALPLKRRAISCELNAAYWKDSVTYARTAEQKAQAPMLFDVTEWTKPEDEKDADADVPEEVAD